MPNSSSTHATMNATLEWDDNGQPVSSQFDDVYFSKVSGIEETRYVFLDHNKLQERFSQLHRAKTPNQTFVIGETGFGTGLNFLCAWQLFEQHAPATGQLHFISTEKYPLSTRDLKKALSLWPELATYSHLLLEAYMPACQGFHHLIFAEGRIRLTLLVGDALNTLPGIEAKVNAWFLDGFAPSKNPGMWQPGLFRTLAEKSAENATYATFTAARMVRNGLQQAGFSIEKTPGFGRKRHMICGQLQQMPEQAVPQAVWNQIPSHHSPDRSAVVIGGGLAGTSCARSLAERGWKVTLLERHPQLATEASGNPQGILYAKLSANNTPLSQLVLQGYSFTLNRLRQLEKQHPGLQHPCGVIQLCTSESITRRYQQLHYQLPDEVLQLLNKKQLSSIAGLPIEHNGLYFPEAGWVSPPSVCQALVDHPHITVKTGVAIDELIKTTNNWLLKSQEQPFMTANTVIIAGGLSSIQLPQLSHLPIKGIRGQVTRVKATEHSSKLGSVVCGEGYVAPAWQQAHTLGATFDFHSDDLSVSDADHERNLTMQSAWLPSFTQALDEGRCQIEGGKAGFRSTTPDYLPLVGPIVDRKVFLNDFAPLRKNRKHPFSKAPEFLSGLYITAGHGSRGLITCPLAGEILAAMINGDPSPVPQDILAHLNPVRYLVRGLSRNEPPATTTQPK
ncbi:bifunctional tRNA (5-methylaminomethyl-2-thiouridine)(34)-methyltransferase MnmD/FAD-dependent 5-carboxymethylaminomethyl-2-thiouridine(34) oxidoreductase MnmC [Endozoicomonas sp. Mp262]|uniref:bifunctional tRNA (5-methylaminomethyl-2-thiouridine)(34)-methyltransferase MnmD/FAD-dependent 5-carboxymethylaminomethyl-2-thiouridine(34) oxidoreductase MnmC n=1 Tax=Endozoicomonas sp. Mp262 TaxID=2919499 RepID=UPI0021DA38B2